MLTRLNIRTRTPIKATLFNKINLHTQYFESKISNYDKQSEDFINYLVESESQYSTLDILSNIDLIPSSSEIEDPISWAARTSLPPI